MRFLRPSLTFLTATVLLAGCGYTADTIAPVAPTFKSVHGHIMGGQQPVVGSVVSVYALGVGGDASLLASTTSDQDGNFQFGAYICPSLPVPESSRTRKMVPLAAQGARNETVPEFKKLNLKGAARLPKGHARPADLPDLTQAYVYLTATGGNPGGGSNSSILLATGLGTCADAQEENVEVNEVSTAVFATVMKNYDDGGSDYGTYSSGFEAVNSMDIADTNTIKTFLDVSSGMVQPNVVATGPAGTSVTIEAAKIYSLANALASCVNSNDDLTNPNSPVASSACQALFAAVPFGIATNTLDAAVYVGYEPYYNVAGIWALGSSKPPFAGGLTTAPNDWTVGISYTTSAMGLGLFPAADGSPTSSNIDIDSSGRVWFPTDKSGATGVGYFDPTETSFNGPFGGEGLVQPQYVGLDDGNEYAWVTDLGSPNLTFVSTTLGEPNGYDSFSLSDMLGGPEAPYSGPIFVDTTVGDTLALGYKDSQGGYDMALVPTDGSPTGSIAGAFVLAPTGLTVNTTLGIDYNDPNDPIGVAATSGPGGPCGLEVAGNADQGALPQPFVIVAFPCASGGAATGALLPYPNQNGNFQDEVTAATNASEICSQIDGYCFAPTAINASNVTVNLANGPVGLAFDGQNFLWMANSGNASIGTYFGDSDPGLYDPDSDRPYLHGSADGGTMTNPTGIAIDGAGNVWVSNASCMTPTDTSCSFTLSEVIGAAYPTITPVGNQVYQLQGTEPNVGGFAGAMSKKASLRMRLEKKGKAVSR